MKTIQINTYQFSELDEKAQQYAIKKLEDINVDYNWWESSYQDAETIGLKLTGFTFDRYNITGEFIDSAFDIANKIISEHGETCDTHQAALNYIEDYNAAISHGVGDAHLNELDKDFLNALLRCYYKQLQNEYDHLISKEAIIESIESNDFEFTIKGIIFNPNQF